MRKIFHWFVVEGWSVARIARELTQTGAPKDHRSTTPGWHPQAVRRVYRNEKYVGVWVWGEGDERPQPAHCPARVPLVPAEHPVADADLLDRPHPARHQERRPGHEARFARRLEEVQEGGVLLPAGVRRPLAWGARRQLPAHHPHRRVAPGRLRVLTQFLDQLVVVLQQRRAALKNDLRFVTIID